LGREASTNTKVVVKQYKTSQLRGIFRELKIFTFIERARNGDGVKEPKLAEIIERTNQRNDGLPDLLAYRVSDGHGELMMTDAGKPISFFKQRIRSAEGKIDFMKAMIAQVAIALKKIHEFGYSHSDLKPENICCRVTS